MLHLCELKCKDHNYTELSPKGSKVYSVAIGKIQKKAVKQSRKAYEWQQKAQNTQKSAHKAGNLQGMRQQLKSKQKRQSYTKQQGVVMAVTLVYKEN